MSKHLLTPSRWLRRTALAVAACGTLTGNAQEAPTAPANLKATVNGTKVVLEWDNADIAQPVLTEDFEKGEFPTEGWSRVTTNTTDYRCSWFHYPTEDFTYLDNWEDYMHTGERSAMVYPDMMAPHWNGDPGTQNEWLITPPLAGAAYLDFYCFIDPKILEYGAYEEFPDHYTVQITHDDGQTWQVLWDARYDSNGSSDWQLVSLYLGESTDKTRVAFVAQGSQANPDEALYFLWALDDITFSANAQAAAQARARHTEKAVPATPGMKTHRPFSTAGCHRLSDTVLKTRASRTLAAPAGSYKVYINGEVLAEGIHSRYYEDLADKEPGNYTYAVAAVSGTDGTESDRAEVEVTVEEPTFFPPSNVTTETYYDEESDTYEVVLLWDAPEGKRVPAYYNVYCDGKEIGTYLPLGEMGQSMLQRGVYDYAVSAVYEYPAGESELVVRQVAPGTRYPANNLKASQKGHAVTLQWEAPLASEHELKGYAVYRNNTLLSEAVTETAYEDAECPDGYFTYAVKAVYADGEMSLPRQAKVEMGFESALPLPYSETFDGDLVPEGWDVNDLFAGTADYYLWRFDNWYRLPVSEEAGFTGGFASISSDAAGFEEIASAIVTPLIDCTGVAEGQSVVLSFDMDFPDGGSAAAALEISDSDTGRWETFTRLEGYDAYDGESGAGNVSFDITEQARGKQIRLRWTYSAMFDYYLAFNNVKVEAVSSDGIQASASAAAEIALRNGALHVGTAGAAIRSIRLYTPDGAEACHVAGNGLSSQAVAVAGLQKGIYLVTVETADGTQTAKVLLGK